MNHNINSSENEKTAPQSALEIATEYFLKGWQPIPVPTRSKNPNFPNWHVHRTTRLDELTTHFNGKPQNVSVLLGTASNDLTDVDLDSRWAVELTTYFLPDTGAIFGRSSKKRSHFLYYCPDAKTEKFQSSEMIAEIRSTGTQTVFPGSIHECGEPIIWYDADEPAQVSFQDLRAAVGRLSAAALLAELWVDTKRHDLSLCVSGALLTNGFSFEDAYLFVKAICTVTKDEEISNRLKAVETTYERIQEEKNVVGFPRLAELVGIKAVGLLRRWLNFSAKQETEIETIHTNDGLENYRLTEQGLFYIFYERTRGGKIKEVETFVCSPLNVVATGKDADDGERTQIVEFANDDGRTKRINIPLRGLVTEPQSILGELVANGLIINSREKIRLIDYLIYSKPEKRLTLVYKTGWQGKSFVMPDKIISAANADNTDYLLHGTHSKIKKLKAQGTAQEWRENIARYCVGNSRLIFAVSCAFASVLLPLSNQLGGGFHLRGESSTGKSSALKVAGSVLGCNGENGFNETWRGTQNGIEAVSAYHNHLLLPLDEIKEIKRVEDIGKLIYMLSNGFATSRMTKDITARKRDEWLLLFLSSGELSFQDLTRETKEQTFGGQEARFIDISAVPENSRHGVFENLHGFNNGAEFSSYLNRASVSFYGAAIREFIQYTADNYDKVKETIEEARINFFQHYVDPQASGEVFRVAEKFALVGTGGFLATRIGLTDWQTGEVKCMTIKLFNEWLERRGGIGAFDVSEGCRKIIAAIDKRAHSDFHDLDDELKPKPQNRIGYKRRAESGGTEFVFTSEQFADLCKGYNQKRILSELEDLGFLKIPKDRSIQTKQQKVSLPDFSVRKYVYILTLDGGQESD
ncbi:MAG: DUF927 domain-containing protein [Acidobacteriota bacterium]|nr:DUF927 domain-containing protein [Acidobacteriota bacterium]